MSRSKFIQKMKNLFDEKVKKKKNKKDAIRKLLKRLELRRKKLKRELKRTTNKEKRADIKESIGIIKKQIKKGQSLLA